MTSNDDNLQAIHCKDKVTLTSMHHVICNFNISFLDTYLTLKEDGTNPRNIRKNTKTVQRTQHPVFRQSFLFPLHKDDGMDQLVIDASLYVKDRVRASVVSMVGYVKIGQEVETALGRSQFAKAVIEINKPVTCWHPLKVVTGCDK